MFHRVPAPLVALDLVPFPIGTTRSSPHLAEGLQGTAGSFTPFRMALCLQAECLGEDTSCEAPNPLPRSPAWEGASHQFQTLEVREGPQGKQGLPEGSCLDPPVCLQSTYGLCTSGAKPGKGS